MVLGIVGNKNYNIDFSKYITSNINKIICGNTSEIDQAVILFADSLKIPCTIIESDYKRNRKGAILLRNREIVDTSDCLLAFWDGKAKYVRFAIEYSMKSCKNMQIIFSANTK